MKNLIEIFSSERFSKGVLIVGFFLLIFLFYQAPEFDVILQPLPSRILRRNLTGLQVDYTSEKKLENIEKMDNHNQTEEEEVNSGPTNNSVSENKSTSTNDRWISIGYKSSWFNSPR